MMNKIFKKIILIFILVIININTVFCSTENLSEDKKISLIEFYDKLTSDEKIKMMEVLKNLLSEDWNEMLNDKFDDFSEYYKFSKSYFDDNNNYIMYKKENEKNENKTIKIPYDTIFLHTLIHYLSGYFTEYDEFGEEVEKEKNCSEFIYSINSVRYGLDNLFAEFYSMIKFDVEEINDKKFRIIMRYDFDAPYVKNIKEEKLEKLKDLKEKITDENYAKVLVLYDNSYSEEIIPKDAEPEFFLDILNKINKNIGE